MQAEYHETPVDRGDREPAPTDDLSVASRTLRSVDLLQGAREVLIQHDEKTYRLRVTRNGKLILVK